MHNTRKVEEDTNTTLSQMLKSKFITHLWYISGRSVPSSDEWGFEDMLEVIMEIYIPNSGNSEKKNNQLD